ncbi:MAG: hypothetical protein U1F11_03250 [Steroidobacteraceae bacterium]
MKIAPQPALPKALVEALPAKVGVVVPEEQRKYEQKETRSGVEWAVSLGPGHEKFAREVFGAAFREAPAFDDVASAGKAAGVQAIFVPRIEQYSFATARETGGEYFAVTIRYRFDLLAPDGNKVDSFTLTGYGNSGTEVQGSGAPLELATRAAMRDAAAKFLTQFPEQPIAKQLAGGAVLAAAAEPAAAAPLAAQVIELVPVHEPRRRAATSP